ncbi:MAG: hypothetical protein OXU23_16210 [Candidatus Poribacteria bacterium]|nr:hypothetical protein [Candidatus Poribacteria bacterium]
MERVSFNGLQHVKTESGLMPLPHADELKRKIVMTTNEVDRDLGL